VHDRQWSPAERTAWLAAENARVIRDRALKPPQRTSDPWTDLAAADDHFDRIDRARDRADQQYRAASAAAQSSLSPEDTAEAGRLQIERDRLWSARAEALPNRDRLLSPYQDWDEW
jgi:hypothetical protein